jgi:peptidoglycan hydrolase-like amidase
MPALAIAAAVRIGVFGLFHPALFEIQPARGGVLVIESHGREQVLEGAASVRLRSAARVTGRDGAEAAFVLSVPGKIRREFYGRLEIKEQGSRLAAIVEMDLETAVGSIVAAEGADATPLEARKAQAVVARSFLTAARGRHAGFDFCDTTHCQFLRSPPAESSAAFQAASQTRGMALNYDGRVIAALYSADCGGRTRTLEQAGWGGQEISGYPYFAVECPVHGAVSGHRIGMCQAGAAEMARRGAGFREILGRYFPAAAIASLNHTAERGLRSNAP